MKKVLITVGLVFLAGVAWHYRFVLEKYFKKLPEIAQSPIIQQIKQDISAPPPLVGKLTGQASTLTISGVIKWTNENRSENGELLALTENTKLNQAAQLKLADMFKQQYFEHVSPQGVGPSDLAAKVHYDFISEGENLALGNYKDDQDLVTAWMNSPGHRANILNTKYTEIGVAVGKGMYQGHETWLSVQEFGRPTTACPKVDLNLKTQISVEQSQLDTEQAQLTEKKNNLDSNHPTSREEYKVYNDEVSAYNAEVADYNAKLQVLKHKIATYNAQVNAYNVCLEK